ncbi:glycoside hydrolase family 19 protein [Ramlibacter sp.]|uniref:glycoside hydrolase family 19 protein n=1 Tax=Ramlibacter sp. TaxID=1917967 RepID=UPI002D7146AA|nr:glycoside hydrolase family 19 protein [Ramlibacter sp.]HYD75927.1 glycoside hydrolase family 19 protein [Ramlibacter sp.]
MLETSHLEQVMRQASRQRLRAFTPLLAAAMSQFGIDRSLRRAAAFIAQLAHESGQFRYLQELWGPTEAQRRYEPPGALARRLGNVQEGDGYRYRGRGPIQLTGRANYAAFGALLQIDLEGDPDLAATPEVGFKTAALFWERNGLNALADAGNFDAITRRINGGTNGLEERRRFYELGLQVLAPVFPAAVPAGAAGAAPTANPLDRGAEAVRELAPSRRTDTRTGAPAPAKNKAKPARRLDVRPDTLDFRDRMFVPTLVEVPTHIPLGDYLDVGVPILDQGREGACTGYGLATVCNYLLLQRRVVPDPVPVSARMLYHLARRYDEWPGEAYEGSSARGAMKGWHKHGVCPEELYPSSGKDRGLELTEQRTAEARRRPLGAYYRVNHKDIVAMHSALAEVGILYATALVHAGWDEVGEDGAVPLSDRVLGGHAFAIVAYDDQGFWIQNSWGLDWGSGGFARISYDDWLRNGTDVWVARLGAPVTLRSAESTATAHSAAARQSVAYAYADLRPHIVAIGNDGKLRPGGDYGTTEAGLAQIFREDIPRVTQGWGRRRILLYAHGGLVSEESAVQRLADYRPALLEGEVYPLALIWKTDWWTTMTNLLQDAVRRRRPEGVLDAAKDFMLDRLDDALEPLARVLGGKAAWDEMKENALLASRAGGAGLAVLKHLAALQQAHGPIEVHLVGHSAGSILLAPLLTRLNAAGITVATCTLWAPACTLQLFEDHYRPALQAKGISRFALYVLSDKAEQDDHCAHIYNKSLLYLVSNAFEAQPHIPGFRDGVPLLGMEKFLDDELRGLLTGPHELVVAPDGADLSQAREHGAFDDDASTVGSTFRSILDFSARVARAKAATAQPLPMVQFRRSESSMRDRRRAIEAQAR